MSMSAAMPARTARLLTPFLSILGGAIVVAGFFYSCLFVAVNEACHPRFCHFGVVHRSILSGWQILAIYAHPADPPFIRSITYPYGLISLVPLIIGGIALLVSSGNLLRQPPRWLLLLTLGIVTIGLVVLIYDTALLNGGITGAIYGYVVITTITPLAYAGHTLLYLGYLLIMLGIVQMLKRSKDVQIS